MKWLPVLSLSTLLSIVAFQSYAKVLTWECRFEYRIDADGRTDEKMNLIFKLDTVSKRSLMEGNAGLVDVQMHIGDDGFSFSEKVASGAVQTTTITKDGLAVHSRNTVILGEFVASQFFSRCYFN